MSLIDDFGSAVNDRLLSFFAYKLGHAGIFLCHVSQQVEVLLGGKLSQTFSVCLSLSVCQSLLSLVEQKGREQTSELSAPRTNLGWRRRVEDADRDAMIL